MVTHFVPTNGIDMFCTDAGTGPPLVLLHGFSGVGDNWRLVFPNGVAGHRVLAFDLRGHGRSTNPSGMFTFRESAGDVLGALDRLGLDRVRAIGVSAGAKTLLHIATRQPSRLEAMVLVSATPRFPPQARAAMRSLTEETRTPAEWNQLRQWHPRGDEQIRALWRQARGMADNDEDMNFSPATLSAITARTLIVHGDRDPLYPVELAVELYRGIRDSQLWVVPNGGHGPIFGDQAPAFRNAALPFVT